VKPTLGSLIDRGNPLSNGLIGCWLMNEQSGNRVIDYSGNNYHGNLTINKGRLYGVDFTGDRDSYVALPHISKFSPFSGSVVALVWTESSFTNIKDYILFAAYTDTSNRLFCEYETYSITGYPSATGYLPEFAIGYDGASTTLATAFSPNIVASRKYHVVFTWSMTSGYLRCYMDGVLNHSVALGTVMSFTSSTVFDIGGYNHSAVSVGYTAPVECMYLYNKELNQAEVTSLYQDQYGIFRKRPYWMYYQATSNVPGFMLMMDHFNGGYLHG